MAGRWLGGGGSLAREARAERPQCGRRRGKRQNADGTPGVGPGEVRAERPQCGRRRQCKRAAGAASSLVRRRR